MIFVLTPLCTNGIFLLTLDSPLNIARGHRLQFPITVVFLSLKIIFVLVNSVDPDEMPNYLAFHLDPKIFLGLIRG